MWVHVRFVSFGWRADGGVSEMRDLYLRAMAKKGFKLGGGSRWPRPHAAKLGRTGGWRSCSAVGLATVATQSSEIEVVRF